MEYTAGGSLEAGQNPQETKIFLWWTAKFKELSFKNLLDFNEGIDYTHWHISQTSYKELCPGGHKKTSCGMAWRMAGDWLPWEMR